VSAVAGLLDRTVRYCAETAADPDAFVNARLFDDMAPFHFHAVTAYDILRTRGVPFGKRDYEGRLRTRSV
jgi:hypothetical protein